MFQSARKAAGAMTMETIKSRFGEVTVDTEKALHFPRGLLGMPDQQHFALVAFPNPKMQQFMLLQSLDNAALSFIALPLDLQNAIINTEDLRIACRDVQIAEADLALLLIVSVHRSPGEVKLSVNARAPLLIDSARRTGLQYVFQQETYKVQHML
jgi:flagellar assembly factor FliW